MLHLLQIFEHRSRAKSCKLIAFLLENDKNAINKGKKGKVAKSTRVCPPPVYPFTGVQVLRRKRLILLHLFESISSQLQFLVLLITIQLQEISPLRDFQEFSAVTVYMIDCFKFEMYWFRKELRSRGAWYRVQKPLEPGTTRSGRKLQNPPGRVGPRRHEKKETKDIRKWSFWAISVFFLHFCRFFGAQPGVGDFLFLWVMFFFGIS